MTWNVVAKGGKENQIKASIPPSLWGGGAIAVQWCQVMVTEDEEALAMCWL